MTRVVFFRKRGEFRGVSIQGHSGFAAKGEDLVCAAISMLSINLVNSVETLTKDRPRISSDEDKALISLDFLSSLSPESRLLLSSFELGLRTVQETYGEEYLSLSYKEV